MGTMLFYGAIHIAQQKTSKGVNHRRKLSRSVWVDPNKSLDVRHASMECCFQNYVHRSGRTARALKEGLSVMLIGPEDQQYYKRIVKTLNRGRLQCLVACSYLPLWNSTRRHYIGLFSFAHRRTFASISSGDGLFDGYQTSRHSHETDW